MSITYYVYETIVVEYMDHRDCISKIMICNDRQKIYVKLFDVEKTIQKEETREYLCQNNTWTNKKYKKKYEKQLVTNYRYINKIMNVYKENKIRELL
jgi:hypothetical protein